MKTAIRLLGEDFQHVRWIEPRERLRLLSEGSAEKVYRDSAGNLSTDHEAGKTDGTIKMKRATEDNEDGSSSGGYSPCSLTAADCWRNAAGAVDTLKRALVYKMREQADDPKAVPAAIRTYGRDPAIEKGAIGKQNSDRLGNATDRSMSRVEQYREASDGNRAVTVSAGVVFGIVHRELEAESCFAL
jgi:hypothetical protein